MIQSPGRITYIRASPRHHTASATADIRSPWCSRPLLSAPPPSTALPGLPDRRERDQPRRRVGLAEVAHHDQQVVPAEIEPERRADVAPPLVPDPHHAPPPRGGAPLQPPQPLHQPPRHLTPLPAVRRNPGRRGAGSPPPTGRTSPRPRPAPPPRGPSARAAARRW